MLILKILLTTVHVVVSVVLIVAILLQASKGGGMASTFGGQASSSVFGPRGAASALGKLTQYLAGTFLVLSLTLSLMAGGGRQTTSVTQQVLEQTPASQLPNVEDLNMSTPSAPATTPETPAGDGN